MLLCSCSFLDLPNLLASPNCDFKEDVVKKMVLTLPKHAMSVAVGAGGEVYTLSIRKQIQKMTLPKDPPKQVWSLHSFLLHDNKTAIKEAHIHSEGYSRDLQMISSFLL